MAYLPRVVLLFVVALSNSVLGALLPAGCLQEGSAYLTCTVRSLPGLDLSGVEGGATNIAVQCSDVLIEGSVERLSVPGTETLSVDRCGVRGLAAGALSPSLRRLTLRNADWRGAALRLERDAFVGLTRLWHVDLSENGMRTLPGHVFCPLVGLKSLNLSSNWLADASELGFSDWGEGPARPGRTCNVGLETLDLSNNELISLPDNALTSLRALTALYLQENAITNLADRALVGLVSLQTLNASSNRLTALPPELFQSSRDLREVHLNNNSISVLAPGLLEGLDQLLVLDLSANRLTSSVVNRDTFSGLVRLVVLNIGYNSIAKIDVHLFRDLFSLQILNLEHNLIETLPEGIFFSLNNLHALTLTHNRLTKIDSHHLSGLYALNQLFIDKNHVSVIHPRAFENCSNLHHLGLSGNRLDDVPITVRQLRFLKTLDLGDNKIKEISGDDWQGLDQVFGLRLIGNEITNLTKDSFSTLPSLQVLNLASNKIERIEKGAFGRIATLQAIRLDGNRLRDLEGAVSSLPGLVWLNVSANRLRWFDYGLMPASLEWLDMHDNAVPELGGQPPSPSRLKMIDAGGNRLTEISPSSIPASAETVLLNNNSIRRVAAGTFESKVNLSRVSLFGNELETLEPAALRAAHGPGSVVFHLGSNPWRCDCHTEWLQRANHRAPVIADLDTLTCATLHARTSPSPPPRLMELPPDRFLCPYESHCFALCHCCDFDACDCEMTCPANCTCYHDHAWGANIVDCSLAGYTRVPPNIPMDATEIYLDGNDLGQLGNHLFIGKKKLKVLYLNNSNVKSLHDRTFNGASSLRVLNLENNDLLELAGSEFDKLDNLEELYLRGNEIAKVDKGSLDGLNKLRVVSVSGGSGEWTWLPKGLERIEGGVGCSCSEATKAEAWLAAASPGLSADIVPCIGGATTLGAALANCRREAAAAAAAAAVSGPAPDYVPFVAASLAASLLVLAVAVAAFLLRAEFCLWAHARYGVRPCRRPDPADQRLYDAYVIYSAKDEEFVSRAIGGPLERQGYSLCLHHRDLHASPAYLAESVMGASEAARRLLIILSLSFLQDEWSSPAFRAALRSSLERSRRRRVLVLLTTEPTAEPELTLLLKAARVVSWGDSRFWAKLRYALPDPRGGGVKAPGTGPGQDTARYTAAPRGWPDEPHSYVTIDNYPPDNLYHTIPDSKQYFV